MSATSASITAFPAAASKVERAGVDPNRASLKVWVAVLAAMIGSFMAILNIQITNASLLNIEGGIGTGVDNGSWISTSYLIGEIVVIPLTDYLSRVFSFRRYMLASAVLFAVFSVACAFAHDLPSMIAMRGVQGFAGGVLIPMAFTLVLTKLPKPQQPVGLAIFALSVTFAPAIGPTIGGYLTENYGWQTIFFVNVIPTLVMVSALYLTLERQPMQLKLLREGDWAGIAAMAVGLSAFQTVLEEGNKDDWLSSPFILRLAIISLVSLSLFVWIELSIEKPLIQLRLLARRNFGFGTIAMTMLGFALFGSVYILPAYLGQAQGYNAEQIGEVMAWTGLPQLILIPLVPKLMKRFDTRYIAFTGLIIFAYSCFMNTGMSPDYAGDQLWIPNIVRAIGQAMVLTPLTSVTTGDIAPQDAAAASGISNMFRNMGGAIGTAVLATVITKREQFHSNIIGQSVTLGREEVRNRIAQMSDYFMSHGVPDAAAAKQQAIIALGKSVKHQALVMGFSDTFAVISGVLVLSAIAVLLTRKVNAGGGAGAHINEIIRDRYAHAGDLVEAALGYLENLLRRAGIRRRQRRWRYFARFPASVSITHDMVLAPFGSAPSSDFANRAGTSGPKAAGGLLMAAVQVCFLDPIYPETEKLVLNAVPKDWRVTFVREREAKAKADGLRNADIAFVIAAPLTADLIQGAPKLRLVQKLGAGIDRIDLAACKERNIAVARLAASNAIPVAEHTVLLMLATLRHLPSMDASVRRNEWKKEEARAHNRHLRGLTVGLVGLGAIGKEVTRILTGFGVTILYYDPIRASTEIEAEIGVSYVGLDDLLARSDVLSLHLPLLPSTRNIMDAARIARMKPGAILINCARGELVDDAALLQALESGHLSGAGLDVYAVEPPRDNPLLKSDRVVLTPHLAGATSNNFTNVVERAVKNAIACLAGQPLPAADLVSAK